MMNLQCNFDLGQHVKIADTLRGPLIGTVQEVTFTRGPGRPSYFVRYATHEGEIAHTQAFEEDLAPVE